jgi:hypothetical protein
MWVPPHPHSGLQTVSWLLEGEVQHRDSLGSNAVVVPGQLNLMTSGAGISHSEESPTGHSALMHGLQLWVALPDPARMEAPRDFTQYRDLPVVERPGLRATVVLGEFEGTASPATTYTPIVGVELAIDGAAVLELDEAFEYGVLAVDGALSVEGQRVDRSEIGYLGGGRVRVSVAAAGDRPTRAFLLGGEPFAERLVMWWNFIGRSHEEIVEFRRIWNSADRSYDGGPQPGVVAFGQVLGFDGERLPAPPMPTTRLRSRPRSR